MNDKQNTTDHTGRKPYVIPPAQTVENTNRNINENPRANENIRVRTEEPETRTQETSYGVGSEITDGEDA